MKIEKTQNIKHPSKKLKLIHYNITKPIKIKITLASEPRNRTSKNNTIQKINKKFKFFWGKKNEIKFVFVLILFIIFWFPNFISQTYLYKLSKLPEKKHDTQMKQIT